MTIRLHHPLVSRNVQLLWLLLAGGAGCSADTLAPVEHHVPVAIKQDRVANWGQRGRVVTADVVRRWTKKQVAEALVARTKDPEALVAFDTIYDVVQYHVAFTTVDAFGEPTVASAGVFVPDTTGLSLPLVSFSHGTQTDKHKVPSTTAFINPQGPINAAHGSIAVLADYLGMGDDSASIVPYLIADPEAGESLDALRAARRFVKTLGLSLDGRLFLYGYSEGGSVSMALAREIEREPRSGFTVTAVAPMAGLYALYEIGREGLKGPSKVPSATGVVLILAAYQAVYHVAGSLDELLLPAYVADAQRLITKGMTDAEAQKLFGGRNPRDVMTQATIEAWRDDPESPLARALRANATYEWVPRAPMKLYYGELDVVVSPQNTAIAYEYMKARGADVETVMFAGRDHGGSQWPSYIAARKWFDTFPVPDNVSEEDDEQEDPRQ